jgi:acyl-CoA thioester hydrolase
VITRRSRYAVRVAYQDTDQARVVHHASYLRYLEGARVEFWRAHGFDYDRFEKESGLGLPVIEARLHYRKSARFDDLLHVETWISRATRASVWMAATIVRGTELIAESEIRLACVRFEDAALRRIPGELLDACLEPGHGV